MCCGLGEEEHTRFRKQKEKKLIVAKSGLVGIKGYLKQGRIKRGTLGHAPPFG